MTASKAIIEKEYQPKVIVSKQGPNPFTKLTDQELEEYRKEVEQKQKGTEGKGGEWMRESKKGVGFSSSQQIFCLPIKIANSHIVTSNI